MTAYYETISDYINAEVAPAIESGEAVDVDMEALAAEVTEYEPGCGFHQTATSEEFWAAVERLAR